MKLFRIPFSVCRHNLRKWIYDSRTIIIFLIMLIVNNRLANLFLAYSAQLGDVGVAPWYFVFLLNSYAMAKLLMFFPIMLLFCDAPFIDSNQPYIIARATRKTWCLGQLLYIFVASLIYTLTSIFCSFIMIIGKVDWTLDWGRAIYTAGDPNNGGLADQKILHYFDPITAMFYSAFLMWMTCIFIGLLVYVINAATQRNGYGVMAGCFFIMWDYVYPSFTAFNPGLRWIRYVSPVTWCSIGKINIQGETYGPNITYILCAYAVLIIGLSAAAVMISRKQEINVIQAV